ncbi:hypothetical protein [Gluconobacter roseus]|uniref:DUF4870 domain-containing protein n=1 Tax=Gluconobacter roseus NBRC 3990 TaxID=1307950 RepID=A0A4Y3M6V1_9PROT|nr:hypothetical protein [Gluconobacter roseus]KXV42824.1 hypothetical protein AD943_12255 [Gluconobacter roseus]GBR48974.1 hypothetical protein AA3990_2338 [Gluconobacter roseus NBRC 3990]GEB04293.1 hypothetical protein GRO01_18690 [Gluconobacter roseus NBRC 3990]GLP92736.1 hypothetical protein GCM10007871_07140 [Gluconobacter roseus NBRC 3990]
MSEFSRSSHDLSRNVSRGGVLLVYALYIARFFTGISLLAGVILAYILRRSSVGMERAHLNWLVRLFWYDVAFIIGTAALFLACFVTEPPGSSGPGQLLFLLPIGIFVLWNIVMLVSLVLGLRGFLAGRGPLPERFRVLAE